jgi:hypothetical protein
MLSRIIRPGDINYKIIAKDRELAKEIEKAKALMA